MKKIRKIDRKNKEIGLLKNQLKNLCLSKKDNQICKNVLKWIDENIGKNNYFTVEELKKKMKFKIVEYIFFSYLFMKKNICLDFLLII